MSLPVAGIPGSVAGLSSPGGSPLAPVARSGGVAFGDLVTQFVGQTNHQQLQADASIQELVRGESNDVQKVVMAVAQADLSFQLFMEIRNKLIDSYNELMRMQF